MNPIILSCDTSIYISNSLPTSNHSKSKNLFSGIIHKNIDTTYLYKSLLKFDLTTIKDKKIDSAYLNIFVEDLRSSGNNFLAIYDNTNDFDEHTLNWNKYPVTNNLTKVILNLELDNINKYIKINITSLLTSWINNNYNNGLTIEPNSKESSIIVQFASMSSNNPPYIEINNDIEFMDSSEEDTLSGPLVILEMYSSLLESCKANEEYINSINTALNSKIEALSGCFDELNCNLSTNYDTLSNNIRTIEYSTSSKEVELNSLYDTIHNLNNDFSVVQENLTTINNKLRFVEDNISSLAKKIDDLDNYNNILCNNLSKAEDILASTNSNNSSICKNIDTIKSDINMLKDESKNLTVNNSAMTEKYKTLNKSNCDLNNKLDNINSELTNIISNHDELINTVVELSTDLTNINKTLSIISIEHINY